jgi:hypothetical protein
MATKVQYDAISRTFKLIGQDFRILLEGDGLYDLAIPLMLEEAEVEDHSSARGITIAIARTRMMTSRVG